MTFKQPPQSYLQFQEVVFLKCCHGSRGVGGWVGFLAQCGHEIYFVWCHSLGGDSPGLLCDLSHSLTVSPGVFQVAFSLSLLLCKVGG